MSTRLYDDFRPDWYQLTELEVSSREVGDRMEKLAAAALKQFRNQDRITVTAIASDGFVRQITRYRGEDPDRPRTCPHCGNML